MSFIDRLESLLQKKNISAHKMSLDIGLNKNAVSAWKEKNNLPNGETLQKIADYFNVSTDYLLGRTNNPSPTGEIFALSSDIPYEDLPPEALEELENMKQYIIAKYKKK